MVPISIAAQSALQFYAATASAKRQKTLLRNVKEDSEVIRDSDLLNDPNAVEHKMEEGGRSPQIDENVNLIGDSGEGAGGGKDNINAGAEAQEKISNYPKEEPSLSGMSMRLYYRVAPHQKSTRAGYLGTSIRIKAKQFLEDAGNFVKDIFAKDSNKKVEKVTALTQKEMEELRAQEQLIEEDRQKYGAQNFEMDDAHSSDGDLSRGEFSDSEDEPAPKEQDTREAVAEASQETAQDMIQNGEPKLTMDEEFALRVKQKKELEY